jgi:hypothetical protein
VGVRAWCREFRRRWPLLVAILRGDMVIFGAQLGPPEEGLIVMRSGRRGVVMDTHFAGWHRVLADAEGS